MKAKKEQILEQNQDFESVLAEEYRREAGVSDSFAAGLLKLNKVSGAPAKKKPSSGSDRKLAQRLLLRK